MNNPPLDAAIVAALADYGARAVAWRMLSSIRTSRHRRTALRVDLADGRRVKVRAVEDEATARRLAEVRAQAPVGFASVLHVHRAVLIEAWVDGAALAHDVRDADLAQAAALLAALHRTPMLSGRSLLTATPTAPEYALAADALARLARHGHLAPSEAETIGAVLAHRNPGVATTAFVHTDFCGENIVVDGEGRLHVVDNERMDAGALGLDVARAWYRWGLADHAWARFRDDYAAAMPAADALADLPFWALVATLKSAALRLELAPAGVASALAAVRRAWAQAEREA